MSVATRISIQKSYFARFGCAKPSFGFYGPEKVDAIVAEQLRQFSDDIFPCPLVKVPAKESA
jgi:hypothetical protein